MSSPASVKGRARNIFLDPLTGRFALENGNLKMVADLDSVAQGVRCAIGLYEGEWFLDETKGVPWLTRILGKGVSAPLATEALRSAAAGVRGVVSVPTCKLAIDAKTRKLSATVNAKADLARLAANFVEPTDVGV